MKRKYITPTIMTVTLRQSAALLAGSVMDIQLMDDSMTADESVEVL